MTGQTKAARFEAIVLPHLDAAYNLARWLARNDSDAEDIVQEAYLRAFRFFDGFQGEEGRAWLLAIVRNTCYTWLRQTAGEPSNEPFDEEAPGLSDRVSATRQEASDGNPERQLSQEDDRQAINEALRRLPLGYREIVILRELEDLSYKEIAAVADIPVGTVMSRLARARKLLWQYLAPLKERL